MSCLLDSSTVIDCSVELLEMSPPTGVQRNLCISLRYEICGSGDRSNLYGFSQFSLEVRVIRGTPRETLQN